MIKIPACVPAVFVSIAKSLVFLKRYARTVNLAVAEGSRTLFPEKARERKKKAGGKSYGREEDLIDRTTAGKGQLARVLPWKSSNFSGDVHGSPLSCSCSFNPEKTVIPTTMTKGESVAAMESSEK